MTEPGDVYEVAQAITETMLEAMRVMYYAHHEWPGWGTQTLNKAADTLESRGPDLVDQLRRMARASKKFGTTTVPDA